MARKSGFVRREGRMRREMLWLETDVTSTTISAASGVALITVLNAAALALRPFTVIRSRGYLHVESDQVGGSENFQVGYGQIVVTDVASAAGVGSVPTPEAESSSDWQTYVWLMGTFTLVSAAGFDAHAGFGREFDSKAMRKVDLGDDLVEVVEAATTSSGFNVKVFNRSLVKLH